MSHFIRLLLMWSILSPPRSPSLQRFLQNSGWLLWWWSPKFGNFDLVNICQANTLIWQIFVKQGLNLVNICQAKTLIRKVRCEQSEPSPPAPPCPAGQLLSTLCPGLAPAWIYSLYVDFKTFFKAWKLETCCRCRPVSRCLPTEWHRNLDQCPHRTWGDQERQKSWEMSSD